MTRSARLRHHVDQCRISALHNRNRALQRRAKILGVGNRTLAMHPHTLREFRVVDVRSLESSSDMRTRNTAIVAVSHALDVHELLMVATIIGLDAKRGNRGLSR